jgi:hypothetical protein
MTMDVERQAWSGRAGVVDALSRGATGVALWWRAFREARRAVKSQVDLANLSDHMRRDLGLLPKAMSHHRRVRDGLY